MPAPEPWPVGRMTAFVTIGLAIYLGLFATAEHIVRRTGDRNPFFRIVIQSNPQQDWIILGASHALPLDFAGIEQEIEAETGTSILNLAAVGTGPFVHRLIAERYFQDHDAGSVLIVADRFGFTAADWNEERIGDSDLLPRIPWDPKTLGLFWRALGDGLPVATLIDYATGFSKINNRDRLEPDEWEGVDRFERRARPSALADRQRIEYLYPASISEQTVARYLDQLKQTVQLAQAHGARVVVVRPPVPGRFRKLEPEESAFNDRLDAMLQAQRVTLHDFGDLLPEPKFYFDTDHLNRSGVEAWLQSGLAEILGNGR